MTEIYSDMINSIMRKEYRIPSITAYNRLEPNPRTPHFDRSLKAEVRDPLWMLTRQWQFGEFQGEDAASPVTAQILGEHTVMDRLGFPQGQVFRYDENIPLETEIEREKLRGDLSLAVQMGRYFFKLIRLKSLDGYIGKLLSRYPLKKVTDINDREGQQLFYATYGKVCDGYRLYIDMITTDDGQIQTRYANWVDEIRNNDDDKKKLNESAGAFKEWFRRSYNQPEPDIDSAWLPSQLEYQFTLASPMREKQCALVADQYYQGHLDWFSFDIDFRKKLLLTGEPVRDDSITENLVSFIPSPIAFQGMPNPRFWAMEENQTNFNNIDTSTTGLLHLLFAEFGLIYSNDWFSLPYPLSINTLCEIKGIVITDVFGQHVLIRPAGGGPESSWQRWAMFHHTDRNDLNSITNLFYLPPALTKTLEGDSLEQVNYLRDEMLNMVWTIENIVPSQAGKGLNGNEMALRKTSASLPPADTPSIDKPKIRYLLGSTVPDNWIPFIPVRINGSDSEIRLQRARMPVSKRAAGVLLTEKTAPYFINEEEIPRAGVIVRRSFQRARWLNGKTYLWIGRYKEAGKGEGWSNLKFDQIKLI